MFYILKFTYLYHSRGFLFNNFFFYKYCIHFLAHQHIVGPSLKNSSKKKKKAEKKGTDDNTEMSDRTVSSPFGENETTHKYLPKDLSRTRWSAKRAASRALITSCERLQNTLYEISKDQLQES